MTTKSKGFGGQWVDVFRAGKQRDDKGNEHELDVSFLEQVVANLKPEEHEAPATIGHPKTDAPAYGWVCDLRTEGDVLQAQFCDVDPAFEQLVRDGKFKKRSASFYLDASKSPGGRVPQLRHVGFLGAQPPAVKGLRDIHFHEGEAITFEDITFSEGDSSMEEKDKKEITDGLWERIKAAFGGGAEKSPAQEASFSEADVKKLIDDAVKGVETKYSTEFEKLRTQVDKTSGSAARAEIVSFCEGLGSGKFLPAFRRMGAVEFMEQLAAADDRKVAVISFAEEGGKQVEKKIEMPLLGWFQNFLAALPPFIEFGEKFGDLKVTSTGAEIVDPTEMEKLRKGMGINKNEGGGK
ncbi:MAG: hypothetical protein ABW250_26815 [Pyrinomonadaceae bacterium]